MSVCFRRKYVIFCAIWYHFYKVKNVKNTHGGVARLVKLQAKACSFTKSSTLPWVFFLFFQLYKSRKASLIQSSFAYRVLPRIFALEPHFEPLKHCIETLRKDVKFSKNFERSFYLIKCGSKWVKVNNMASGFPANIYLFKGINQNTRKRCGIYSKLTLKTSEWCHWHRSSVFIVNFEHTCYLFLVFLLFTLNK